MAGEWVFNKIEATFIKTKNIEVEEGITMKDKATGQYWCVTLQNGEFVKEQGKCNETADSGGLTEPPTAELTSSPMAPQTTDLGGNNQTQDLSLPSVLPQANGGGQANPEALNPNDEQNQDEQMTNNNQDHQDQVLENPNLNELNNSQEPTSDTSGSSENEIALPQLEENSEDNEEDEDSTLNLNNGEQQTTSNEEGAGDTNESEEQINPGAAID